MTCGDCIHFRDNGGGWNTCSLPRAEDDGKGKDPACEACKDFQASVCSSCKFQQLLTKVASMLAADIIKQLQEEDREFVETITGERDRIKDHARDEEAFKTCASCKHFQLEKFHVGTCDLGAEGHNVACVHDDACEDYQERE